MADTNPWRLKKPEKYREFGRQYARARRLKAYGITEDQLASGWGQPSHCRACGCTQTTHKKGFTIDHDHKTGRVRGVLCSPCNVIAGHAKDSPQHLRAVAAYLELPQ